MPKPSNEILGKQNSHRVGGSKEGCLEGIGKRKAVNSHSKEEEEKDIFSAGWTRLNRKKRSQREETRQ